MAVKVYEYAKCSTCRKAAKYLDTKGVKYTLIPIRETPPSKTDLKKALKYYKGEIKRLLNTSGQDYRKMNLKEKLPKMNTEEIISMLNENGNLVKRPFVVSGSDYCVGFKEDEWGKIF